MLCTLSSECISSRLMHENASGMKVHLLLHRHLWSSLRRECCKNSNSLPIHWYRLVEDNKEPKKLVIIHSSTGIRPAIKRYPPAEVNSSMPMQVVIKNILESCVSEIDIVRHQKPTRKHQQTARGGSFLCFKTFSKSIEPVEEEGEKLWSLLLRLVNIQSLFPITGQCLKSLVVEAVGISHGLEMETGAVQGSSDRLFLKMTIDVV